MNKEERYLFDLRGYIVVRNALTGAEVEAMNRQLDRHDVWSDSSEGPYSAVKRYNDLIINAGPLHKADRPVRNVIAHESTAPYLVEVLGEDFRYDEGQVLFSRKGAGALILHNGHTPWDYPALTYQVKDGRIYGGHVVIAFCLTDALEDQGGFAIVPGSHKAHFEVPEHYVDWSDPGECVERVPVRAGDAIIFVDTATHGSWPWKADFERRVLFCRYTSGMVMHTSPAPTPENSGFSDWTEVESRVMRPPFAWNVVADEQGYREVQRTDVLSDSGWTMQEYGRQIIATRENQTEDEGK